MLTSLSNPRVKAIRHLHKARERRKQNQFVIEGRKEIEKAAASGYHFNAVVYCPDIIDGAGVHSLLKDQSPELLEVDQKVFAHLAYRGDSGGLLVVATPKSTEIDQLTLQENPLILVIEGVEKPGNLGAILRSADAAGIDAVIVSDPQIDVYNPNVIRSSIGCIFTVPLGVADTPTTIDWLKQKHVAIHCAALTASKPYTTVDFTNPSAIVMGTEATGLTDQWLESSDQNIIIPMHGVADSMNVSTSAAVILFEAIRQRNQ